MANIDKGELESAAMKRCEGQMNSLVNAKLEIIPEKSETNWDPVWRRHLFRQSFTVWRDFDELEITVSSTGRVTGFRDRNRFLKGNEPNPPIVMSKAEILECADTTGLVGATVSINSSVTDLDGMIEVSLSQVDQGLPESLRMTINPVTKQIAALQIDGDY